jgi:dihydrofolate reductase
MRKIRIIEHVSLDGVMEQNADYEYGAWTAPYRTPAGLAMITEAYGTGYDLLLGRRTYDIWAGYWPKAGSSPMADGLNAATKYVATHRPESLEWGPVKDLGGDMIAHVRVLRAEDGLDLVVSGSSTLTSLLFEEGQVDEVVLAVYPVWLGRGKRVISDNIDARELSFVSTKTTPTGVLLNTYRYVGPLKK